MASPVGHALVAILAGRMREARSVPTWRWFALASLATIAPDLDFVPGALIGDVNRFHHGISHSLGAALLFGLIVSTFTRRARLRIGFAAGALYASHLVLDYLTIDSKPPVGQPLLWPISSTHFAMQAPVLMGIRHNADSGWWGFVIDVLSTHNLRAALREVLLIAPLVMFVWLVIARRADRSGRSVHAVLPRKSRGTTIGAHDMGD